MAAAGQKRVVDVPAPRVEGEHKVSGAAVYAPYHSMSIRETAIMPISAAIANAVEDAVGVRIQEMPITAEKVLAALKRK